MHENERKGLDTFRKKSQGIFERRAEKKGGGETKQDRDWTE